MSKTSIKNWIKDHKRELGIMAFMAVAGGVVGAASAGRGAKMMQKFYNEQFTKATGISLDDFLHSINVVIKNNPSAYYNTIRNADGIKAINGSAITLDQLGELSPILADTLGVPFNNCELTHAIIITKNK